MVGDVEKQAAAGGRAPLKIAVLLPYPVRKIRTPVSSSGVQEDPGVESQYTSTTMRGMRDAMRDVCGKLRCCFALDAWEAAYVRPQDSVDGRHYEIGTPTIAHTANCKYLSHRHHNSILRDVDREIGCDHNSAGPRAGRALPERVIS